MTTDTPCELASASNDETASAALRKGLVGVEIEIEYQHGCVRSSTAAIRAGPSISPQARIVRKPSRCAGPGVIVHLVGGTVVVLGAWSELARRDERGMDIDVREFAVLDDGRRLTLHRDRGFSTSGSHLTAEDLESSVLTTVLPDDAEVTGEDHPWEWLASLIHDQGVGVTPEQLKAVPYVLEFGPGLSALLKAPST